jgi:hypothetical protein
MLRLASALLLGPVLLAAGARAQCTNLSGSCIGGANINCQTPPRIGTTWLINAGQACPPSPNAMLFGTCGPAASIGGLGLACFNCTTCALWLHPIVGVVGWPGIFSLGIPIPNNASLAGGMFCVQNVCAPAATCVCLSNALQVTVLR